MTNREERKWYEVNWGHCFRICWDLGIISK